MRLLMAVLLLPLCFGCSPVMARSDLPAWLGLEWYRIMQSGVRNDHSATRIGAA